MAQIKAASQASKRTSKRNTPLSSLLQAALARFFTAESGLIFGGALGLLMEIARTSEDYLIPVINFVMGVAALSLTPIVILWAWLFYSSNIWLYKIIEADFLQRIHS